MNVPRYAAAAARLLAARLAGRATPAGDRARGIMTIERAMRRRARRRQLIGVGLAFSSAAALALVWHATHSADGYGAASISIVATPVASGASLHAPGFQAELRAASEIGADQVIETPEHGGASLRLSTGTRLELAGQTAFRVEDPGPTQRFALARGELRADVAKLTAGKRFIVTTPDAEVEVRGTSFKLRVLPHREACSPASRTRLEVTEGVVEVRSAGESARVTGGQSWPPSCSQPQAADPLQRKLELADTAHQPNAESPDFALSHARATHSKPKSESQPAHAASSALTRQNDLFAEAVALRRHGDVTRALATYEQLIIQFPGSALVENAMVERMRLFAGTDSVRARAEAERYLARFPRGFAAYDARRLLGRH